jgi:hypothetical protein
MSTGATTRCLDHKLVLFFLSYIVVCIPIFYNEQLKNTNVLICSKRCCEVALGNTPTLLLRSIHYLFPGLGEVVPKSAWTSKSPGGAI